MPRLAASQQSYHKSKLHMLFKPLVGLYLSTTAKFKHISRIYPFIKKALNLALCTHIPNDYNDWHHKIRYLLTYPNVPLHTGTAHRYILNTHIVSSWNVLVAVTLIISHISLYTERTLVPDFESDFFIAFSSFFQHWCRLLSSRHLYIVSTDLDGKKVVIKMYWMDSFQSLHCSHWLWSLVFILLGKERLGASMRKFFQDKFRNKSPDIHFCLQHSHTL